ncbi:trimethylamine corrinoid protein [Dethiosulfatibacter aminovorans DSM 17477]|uniref:Trimethylamine corrinoid protein n=1 Tax=Dethiosulfatibacter aminovorans DSM 17477 TaxID=1121476 RepID=A0A1M6F3T8_9FIRM|nr:cobalamin-dependent protein [Dethiosulfatibacter aminovorans]SHI92377.1 trimethylamine corrinoid protein [Dethiosulfatibacter aminovorans DSM 17477]
MNKENIFSMASESVINSDDKLALEALEMAKSKNIDLMELLSGGFSAGIREMGEKYASGEVFVPELLMAARIMKIITAEIEELMETSDMPKKAKLVIGTVKGDVHDIGKGIVCSIVKSNGIEVYDLGREVPPQTFIDKAEEVGADFIGSSALLTTTMVNQKEIERLLVEQGLKDKYKTLVGGAPATKRWAEKIGAYAYCEDASDTVETILKWVNEREALKEMV